MFKMWKTCEGFVKIDRSTCAGPSGIIKEGMSFGRTSRGLTYEGMKEAISFILDGLDTVDEAELEPINSVETNKIPRTSGKITGAEFNRASMLPRLRALQT